MRIDMIGLGRMGANMTLRIGERFASRGDADFANRLLSALHFEFGGHEEKRP